MTTSSLRVLSSSSNFWASSSKSKCQLAREFDFQNLLSLLNRSSNSLVSLESLASRKRVTLFWENWMSWMNGSFSFSGFLMRDMVFRKESLRCCWTMPAVGLTSIETLLRFSELSAVR